MDVWRIDFAAIAADASLALLDARERARLERLRGERHRQRYSVSHAGLRSVLSRYCDLHPEQIGFQFGPRGKPALADHPEVEFNLTNSGDLALVAVSAVAVGIDLEWLKPQREFVSIAKRMFTPEAASAVASLAGDARTERFYQEWTCFEARVKAIGSGLFADETPAWPAVNFTPAAGAVAAVAIEHAPARVRGLLLTDRNA